MAKNDDLIQSVARSTQVLEALASAGPNGARLPELTAATALNRATVHRLLKSMVALGLVDRDETEARYFPGLKLVSIAAAATDRFHLASVSAERCRSIAEATGDTVFVQLRSGRETVCVARYQGAFPIKTLTLDVGQRRPLGIGAGGIACLSTDPNAEAIIAGLARDYRLFGLDASALSEAVASARLNEFAVDADGVIEGVTGVAVPLRDASGQAFAALTVAAISTRMSGSHRDDVVARLMTEAASLEEVLGPLRSAGTASIRSQVLGEMA